MKLGKNVAIDATNLTVTRRSLWRNFAKNVTGNVEVGLVWLEGKFDSPQRWIESRGFTEEGYWEVRKKLEALVERPTADEGFDFIEYVPPKS